ncbi:MAG: SDR family oxidoreductase [Flavobacteriales bacterium]|nr:SDR family oxidoreductase [Flavobacteriales bacterium]
MSKRVLLTGSTGLIGRHVSRTLHGKHELLLTSHTGQKISEGLTQPFDLRKVDHISAWLGSLKPEVVIHTAAVTSADVAAKSPEEAELINVGATRKIAEWCAEHGARMIHFSTDFVFDGSMSDKVETDEPAPLSWYGETKLKSESVLREVLDDHVIIRPILVYGRAEALSRLNFPLLVVAKLSAGETMRITSDQFRMPTYAQDVAAAVDQLVDHSFTGTMHLAGPDFVNVFAFAERVAALFGLDTHLLQPVTTQEMQFPAQRPLISGFDTSLAQSEIGWAPMGINQALSQMMVDMVV